MQEDITRFCITVDEVRKVTERRYKYYAVDKNKLPAGWEKLPIEELDNFINNNCVFLSDEADPEPEDDFIEDEITISVVEA
jgi:hypothetical protein